MARTQNMSFYAGEDIILACVLDPVVDITGWSIRFMLRDMAGQLPVLITKTVGSGITIVNGPTSRFDIQLLSADTSGLNYEDYVYDIQRTNVGAHTELVVGTVTLLQPPTPIVPP